MLQSYLWAPTQDPSVSYHGLHGQIENHKTIVATVRSLLFATVIKKDKACAKSTFEIASII